MHAASSAGPHGWQRAQMDRPAAGAEFPPSRSKDQELAALKQQTASLEQALGDLKARIQDLDKPTSDASASRP